MDPTPSECPACGKPFDSPDHDPRCSGCVEAGMLGRPAPKSTPGCPCCEWLLRALCLANFELGKAHGQLEGLRAGRGQPGSVPEND